MQCKIVDHSFSPGDRFRALDADWLELQDLTEEDELVFLQYDHVFDVWCTCPRTGQRLMITKGRNIIPLDPVPLATPSIWEDYL